MHRNIHTWEGWILVGRFYLLLVQKHIVARALRIVGPTLPAYPWGGVLLPYACMNTAIMQGDTLSYCWNGGNFCSACRKALPVHQLRFFVDFCLQKSSACRAVHVAIWFAPLTSRSPVGPHYSNGGGPPTRIGGRPLGEAGAHRI